MKTFVKQYFIGQGLCRREFVGQQTKKSTIKAICHSRDILEQQAKKHNQLLQELFIFCQGEEGPSKTTSHAQSRLIGYANHIFQKTIQSFHPRTSTPTMNQQARKIRYADISKRQSLNLDSWQK